MNLIVLGINGVYDAKLTVQANNEYAFYAEYAKI